jgi:hypothetical protein
MRLIRLIATLYWTGAALTFIGNVTLLPTVTHGLAFERSIFWPVYAAVGWPRGEPTRMD